jgi:hypothetical protein
MSLDWLVLVSKSLREGPFSTVQRLDGFRRSSRLTSFTLRFSGFR